MKKAFAESAERYDVKKPEAAPAISVRVEAHDAFDEGKVKGVFDRLIQQQHPDTIVSIALKSHTPEIEGDRIIVKVDNQIQVEKLEAIRHSLQNALMQGLNNGFVQLAIRMFEKTSGEEERRLITAQDKLAYFMEENPVVAEMKKLFGLELE